MVPNNGSLWLPPQTTIRLPVQTAVWNPRAAGAFAVEVGVQVSVEGSYRPPVGVDAPPQMIILVPSQTAVCPDLPPDGAPIVVVGLHASARGSYRPPVTRGKVLPL